MPSGLFVFPWSLASISEALSPHPKIPFLADKAGRLAYASYESWISARLATTSAFGSALLRIQAERFELLAPLC
ncbi:MAG: hypothetical protein ACREDL_16630, partial [Bradyrhizobium sp.]